MFGTWNRTKGKAVPEAELKKRRPQPQERDDDSSGFADEIVSVPDFTDYSSPYTGSDVPDSTGGCDSGSSDSGGFDSGGGGDCGGGDSGGGW